MVERRRIRDPVHGLIVFDGSGRDRVAWQLLNTPEFQRLRRIKQLGVSESVFPGATHTRFAHSIGVFHMARQLVEVIRREMGDIEEERADVAVLAALLHDVGHGPFSHAFEEVQKVALGGRARSHEDWTAEIVRNPGGRIRPVLEEYRTGLADAIADLITAQVPTDIYDAIVSSAFDADRLDYLRRDRLMTGTGAGAIDFDWLIDNLRVTDIDQAPGSGADEDSERIERLSFCFTEKAVQAAESFLLARFHLYTQVYLHKTTRCVEKMIGGLLAAVAATVSNGGGGSLGLSERHPLVMFLTPRSDQLRAYLGMDDAVVWGVIERLTDADEPYVRGLARRLRDRDLYKALDVESAFGENPEVHRREMRRIDRAARDALGRTVFKDQAEFNLYGEIGADDAKAHKRLMILTKDGPVEISLLSKMLLGLSGARRLTRYYFSTRELRDQAKAGGAR